MKPKYKPSTEVQKLAYLVEECGELVQSIGKSLRWGLENYNPELSIEDRETNKEWILREILDVKNAISILEDEWKAYTDK